ncbi:MYCBP-associated protein-like isoform X2 [Corticium candelabrum]|uniref:MYCBP-associated protein-like isoform X2 n=1 Tax=Corticium candelabrum TaxID=121492 RepID=UPI002E26CB28|nr:MYCBP-associated protein-like isoform X2 [Corticium candelabrum]
MATRLGMKQSKKERPKSSDKKTKSSPGEEHTSPEAGNTETGSVKCIGSSEEVLSGEDIASLAVNLETFRRQHAPRPPAEAKPDGKKATVLVRRRKTVATDDERKSKRVTVLRSVPPSSLPSQSNRMATTVPRFDEKGTFVRHSMLGTLEDYQEEAFHRSTERKLVCGTQIPRMDSTADRQSQRSSSRTNLMTARDQHALQNWNKQMLERKRQQGHISKLLQTTEEKLLMNKAEEYREVMECRQVVDRAIAAVDYGKGYRVGSEFWRQHEQIGTDEGGINLTLTQTEKGHPPAIEHVGKSIRTQIETGMFWPAHVAPVNYPWKVSPYLAQRTKQLQPIMNEIDPYYPDFSQLEVLGKAPSRLKGTTVLAALTETSEEPEIEEELMSPTIAVKPSTQPQNGPSLIFGGNHAFWDGIENPEESPEFEPIHARVTFENLCNQISLSSLHIVNDGTTAIYYSWKLVPKTSSLDTCLDQGIQRFYFNTCSGVVLPGRSLDFPFMFKSPYAGIFSETWQLETRPVLCRGAPLLVTLRGVTRREDKLKGIRSDIEAELEHRQAVNAVMRLVNELVDAVRTPQRVASPLQVLVTEEERFEEANSSLFFSQGAFEELKTLWKNANIPDHLVEPHEVEPAPARRDIGSAKDKVKKHGGGKEGSKPSTQGGAKAGTDVEYRLPPELQKELDELIIEEWDLSIRSLKKRILLVETDARREDYLAHVNRIVVSMSFPPLNAKQEQLYNIGYELLADWVDLSVSSSARIRNTLGLPEKSFIKSEATEVEQPPPETNKKQKESRGKVGGDKGGGKRDKAAESKGSKRGEKEKVGEDRPTSKSKPVASGRRSRGGGSPPKKGAVTVVEDHVSSEVRIAQSDVDVSKAEDPVLQAKYDEQFYMQVYTSLQIILDRMTMLFEEVSTRGQSTGK